MSFKRLYLSYVIGVVVSILLITFFTVHLFNAILPPKVIITDPKNIEFRTELEEVIIRGMIKRSYFLRISNILVPFSDDGSFEKRISLTRNLNLIKVEAESRFGKKSEKIIKIFHEIEQY
jgi:hypothetical protein